jgi:hypothetical protein
MTLTIQIPVTLKLRIFRMWCLIRYRDSFSFVIYGMTTKHSDTINPIAAKFDLSLTSIHFCILWHFSFGFVIQLHSLGYENTFFIYIYFKIALFRKVMKIICSEGAKYLQDINWQERQWLVCRYQAWVCSLLTSVCFPLFRKLLTEAIITFYQTFVCAPSITHGAEFFFCFYVFVHRYFFKTWCLNHH